MSRSYHPLYQTWHTMIKRCTNPNAFGYARYGGRGITVCERWANSFDAFVEDIGPKPSKDHSLDRIDNDGDYEPDNCRWADKKTQACNMRSNVKVQIGERIETVTDWCAILHLPLGTVFSRISRGWTPVKAITKPSREKAKPAINPTVDWIDWLEI